MNSVEDRSRLSGEGCEQQFDLGSTHLIRMTQVVKANESGDPGDETFHGTNGIVEQTEFAPDPVDQLGGRPGVRVRR